VHLISSMCATCPAHLTALNFISQTITIRQRKLNFYIEIPHSGECWTKKCNFFFFLQKYSLQGCIQKFLHCLPGVRTANGTALCHSMQLYHYFVSQSTEFCHHNTLHYFSTSVYCCKVYSVTDSVQKLLDTPSYLH
jgi:hypothetical protein